VAKARPPCNFFALGFEEIEFKLKKLQGGRAQKKMLVY
jgi:hypothetical protein